MTLTQKNNSEDSQEIDLIKQTLLVSITGFKSAKKCRLKIHERQKIGLFNLAVCFSCPEKVIVSFTIQELLDTYPDQSTIQPLPKHLQSLLTYSKDQLQQLQTVLKENHIQYLKQALLKKKLQVSNNLFMDLLDQIKSELVDIPLERYIQDYKDIAE